jgi:lipopolysaccharide export system protein LptC
MLRLYFGEPAVKATDWIGNLVSVLFFAALAAASWGLSEYLARGRLERAAGTPQGPNAIVERADILRTGPDGLPHYRLQAQRIEHSERDDKSLMLAPTLVTLMKDRPMSTAKSNTAIATENQDRIDLFGDVVMTRAAFADQPAMRMTTPNATLLVKEERAFTEAPVRVERGMSILQGVGMVFDHKTQQIRVLSESRMILPEEEKK